MLANDQWEEMNISAHYLFIIMAFNIAFLSCDTDMFYVSRVWKSKILF